MKNSIYLNFLCKDNTLLIVSCVEGILYIKQRISCFLELLIRRHFTIINFLMFEFNNNNISDDDGSFVTRQYPIWTFMSFNNIELVESDDIVN